MLHNLKKKTLELILRFNNQKFWAHFLTFFSAIGENMKISKKEIKDPSREHDFTHVYQKL